MELFFQLVILALGYAVGIGILALLKLAGLAFAFDAAALMVLTLPLVSALVAEGFAKLWLTTPGAVGLGGLVAFLPLAIAGLFSAAAAVVAQKLLTPLDPDSARNSASLTAWLALALACSIVTLALWRFWPEPRARLW